MSEIDLKKLYEGTEKLDDGRYRIIEKIQVLSSQIKKLPIQESNQKVLVEDQEYNCRGAYTFKIWEVGQKNLNGRVYDEDVCNKVIQKNAVTLGLANHPEDDGNVNDIFAVERNPRISEGWLVSDFLLIGDKGQKVNEILEAGGHIGVSSSALGELDESTGKIVASTFELERYGDWVMNPSNGYKNTIKTENVVKKQENKPSISNLTINNSDNKKHDIDNNIEENIMKTENKLHEKSLILNIKGLLKEAKGIEEPKSRMETLQDIQGYFDESFTNESLEKQTKELIESTEKEISELTEKGKEYDKLSEKVESGDATIQELSEKVETLEKALLEAKDRYQKIKSIVETKNTKKDEKEVSEKINILERERDELVEAVKNAKKEDSKDSKLKEAMKAIKVLEKERDTLTEAVKVLDGEKDSLVETVKKSPKSKKRVSEDNYGWEIRRGEEWDAYNEAIDSGYFKMGDLNEQIVRSMGTDELGESLEFIFRMNDYQSPYLNESVKKSPKSKRTERTMARKSRKPFKPSERVKESYGEEFIEAENIKEYYDYAVKKNPKLKEIEEKIMDSKTVSDAQIKVLRFENQESYREDIKRKQWEMKRLDETIDIVPQSKRLPKKNEMW